MNDHEKINQQKFNAYISQVRKKATKLNPDIYIPKEQSELENILIPLNNLYLEALLDPLTKEMNFARKEYKIIFNNYIDNDTFENWRINGDAKRRFAGLRYAVKTIESILEDRIREFCKCGHTRDFHDHDNECYYNDYPSGGTGCLCSKFIGTDEYEDENQE